MTTLNIIQPGTEHASLAEAYRAVRAQSVVLCVPLTVEDQGLQAVAETSPPKWHLAHTTWFFETFILKPFVPGYQVVDPVFEVLFNSYYNGIGAQHPRHQRGLLSRPSVAEVGAYRDAIDASILALLAQDHPEWTEIAQRLTLGLHHEQQHQELLLTDIKYSFFQNPIFPAYSTRPLAPAERAAPLHWLDFPGSTVITGHQDDGFCFDNEQPAHPFIVAPYQLASRPVTNAEYLAFIADRGYQQPQWWLADGWGNCQEASWQHPLYWVRQGDDWFEFTLHGLQPLDHHAPVCHLSGYEADAYARWAGARLPTEHELEQALKNQPVKGQFVESGDFHPRQHPNANFFGGVWEWTASAYAPYPGFQTAAGAIGEYNGKFMANQLVLKGGSCATPAGHIRASYRNFFYPPDRWQFTGLRLARSKPDSQSSQGTPSWMQ
ncbi:MAG: ergothioneine biosynthesis protein EgtB [Natronospirillum sp.]